ncbi:TAXI family TRAP transporter solute-binding subunit [Streptomyces acidiscabies]|uniref:TAXI family TRAP transporter solute-binding subunit n=2 Tax=Streptomyces acidiscabies TaxID=42234 RepID=A0AAP6B4L6_9ACTN|nr:TAXI family TRAP transporter solute-binding subunit [Streptomyces acidiscabies]MBP5941335.1 TAXI family TRAP transporter solute-binding subunit [Streptomyces sp. LBUM 1476]MBZ3912688.1 TAXI family TRAP transporter solute-binding subunit [Streptomyces acidiscabies]MDX2958171.1 TAXI family TRAP transporter solute-binding subunit [Streptomyces acidiscabies]MDX3018538.1 TAXI family TRAP transporter solute-binding subunit [Streptomyces acidiscabies]MDX3791159.1 TAXI family TRAP transporter solut
MNSRRTILCAALGVTGVAALGGDARLADRGPTGTLRIATGESDGFYAAFGQLLAQQVTAVYPRLTCEVVGSEGSVANVRLLHARRADVALALADIAWSAYAGSGPFAAPVPLRAVGRVYENYAQLAVRAGSTARSVADLAGRTVSVGAPASGGAVLGDRLLRAAGLRPGADVRVRHLLMSQVTGAMRAGAVDAVLLAGGVPMPVLAGLAHDPGIRLLPLAGLLPRVRESGGAGVEAVTVPAGAYEGTAEVATIGVANLLLCRPDLPPPLAAVLTHVLVGRATRLVPASALGTQFLDVRSLISTGEVPLHAGAVAAYRELHG